ncbi:hypothetical protein QO009_003103 [Brevibacillus aydinogluensis]|uniref:DUF6573 family protein n=1 Tax=Brevibacillus aydinogluensis TaxID=927786 RepID=UPI0028935812|nr:DUF6573 family protein [Brevibacillus aydinogluensis]MDT3417208.1 hypothetical protein [Brevibacillus aydinogluensis]
MYIHIYSRAQAIADGVLIDVSEMAKEVGIYIPVAVTHRLWADYITPSSEAIGQTVNGRLWDTLFLLKTEIKNGSLTPVSLPHVLGYNCLFVMGSNELQTVKLKAILSHGDDHKPVLTIMLPEED